MSTRLHSHGSCPSPSSATSPLSHAIELTVELHGYLFSLSIGMSICSSPHLPSPCPSAGDLRPCGEAVFSGDRACPAAGLSGASHRGPRFDQKHPDPQQEPRGYTREVPGRKRRGEGRERGEEARERTRVVNFVPSSPSHFVNLSAADDKPLFLGTQTWDEAKSKESYGKRGRNYKSSYKLLKTAVLVEMG